MTYNPLPPYEVLRTKLIDFPTLQRLRRFARFWDLIGNSGNFVETTPWIWKSPPGGVPAPALSPFYSFLACSEWLHARAGRSESIALLRLMELLFEYLTRQRALPAGEIAMALWRDYRRGGRRDKPGFLKDFLPADTASAEPAAPRSRSLKRQNRHAARV